MATLTRTRVRSDDEAAWAHRHQRAADAVMQTFARDLSSRASRGPLKTRPALSAALSGASQASYEWGPAWIAPLDVPPRPKEVIYMFSRKLTKFVAAGAAAVALAIGGVAIANSGSSSSSASGTASPATANVIPFHRGEPTASKAVGQVPSSFRPGTGTIVTGAAAEKAKAAALVAYPGGTVNRVVLLSNGEYNVHVIAVNWPHHVFVNKEFRVIGAQ
jgi:hypothetical protein